MSAAAICRLQKYRRFFARLFDNTRHRPTFKRNIIIILSVCPFVTVSQKKRCQCYFLNTSTKHWLILIIFGMRYHEKMLFYVNDCSFAYLIFTLLLHYLVKIRCRILAVYNSEFIQGIVHASAQYVTKTTKSLKIGLHRVKCASGASLSY